MTNGIEIVLLRGLLREQRHWGDLPERIRQMIPSARVYTPDLAGCGCRYQQRSPASISGMMEDLRAQIAPAKASVPRYLVALSMGAMVAAEWAACYPEEIAGIVLINTSFASLSASSKRFRRRWILPLLWRSMPWGSVLAKERLILQMTSLQHQRDRALVTEWGRYYRQYPLRLLNVFRQLWAAARYRGRDLRPEVDVTVVCGERDQLVDPSCSFAIAQRWHVPLLMHPDAGHDLPLDQPQWLVELISGYVLEEEPTSSSRA